MYDPDDITDDPPEMPQAFDEAGRPCAVTDPVYPDDEGDGSEPIRADAFTIMREFVRVMTEGATALQTGQRLHVLAYLSGISDATTQRELAAQLNVSPGRVTQILHGIPGDLQSVCRLKGRTAKRRAIGEDE